MFFILGGSFVDGFDSVGVWQSKHTHWVGMVCDFGFFWSVHGDFILGDGSLTMFCNGFDIADVGFSKC